LLPRKLVNGDLTHGLNIYKKLIGIEVRRDSGYQYFLKLAKGAES
jgi:hypothetical protein